MTATLFQASQDGNVELVTSLLEEPSLDIDARDETGLTALHHAVRGNHIDVVSQLLAKGANAVEVAQDAALKQNTELASVINNALQHTQPASFQSAPVVDSHGGKQLPDGTVSYVQPPAYQGHAGMDVSMHQQHALHHPMSQPMYPFQPQHTFFDPSHNPDHRAHAHKDSSSGSLPPPEVAKMIPCRFFPNCRYGDKCMFAHPVAMPASASNAGPVSPGQAPLFYQSPAYGYPAYGPPQHFYSMAPPMPIQYTHAGVPMPVHMPPPPHMAPAPHSAEQGDAYGNHFGAHSRQAFESNQVPEGELESSTQGTPQQAAVEASSSADADKVAPAAEAAATEEEPAKSSSSSTAAAAPSSNNTTSFSAFMAHHATPFQPGPGAQNGVSVGADGSILNNSQTFSRGAKIARRGGASMGGSFGSRADFTKRSTERPACHFFARSACKHGEDCRFPHILPDGTDMRGPNAGRSSHSIEASRAINRALAAKSARGTSAGSNGNGAQSSQGASATAKSDGRSLPPAPTNVTVSTSPASAQTTILPNDTEEASKSSSTEKATTREDAAEQKPAANVNLPASAGTATVAKKEQSNGTKPANAGASTAASSSTPRAAPNLNAGASAKTEQPKVENSAQGKRAAASGAKSEEAKPATNGDRVPASIPSKPLVNGNANNAVSANRQNAVKLQPNGVQGGKGHQNQQNGARARSNQQNNSNGGRTNGPAGQNGAGQKKPVAQQRLPSAADFPALPNGHGPSAPSSSSSSTATPASNVNGVAKANFSAILSAPAPVKKQPEPVKETEAAAADDKATAAGAEAKETKTSASEAETKSSAAPAAAKANGTATPMLDFAAVVQSNPVAV